MEFIIKLKPKFNALYSIGNIKRKLLKDNIETLKVRLEENENFVLSVEPITKNENLLLPYNVYIKNENNFISIESPNTEILNYKNIYVLSLNRLEAVKDMKVLISESNYSVFNTYTTNITTTQGTTKLPCLFDKVELEKNNNYHILTFTGERNYIVVISGGEIIFGDYYNAYKIENKTIEILTDLDDIAKHSILTKIEGRTINKTTVYKYSQPKIVTSEHLVPIAFLQALKVNNIKLCKHYLSGNLKDMATLSTLTSFFGDYKKLEIEDNEVILFYKENDKYSHKIFSFDILDGKIYHISVN